MDIKRGMRTPEGITKHPTHQKDEETQREEYVIPHHRDYEIWREGGGGQDPKDSDSSSSESGNDADHGWKAPPWTTFKNKIVKPHNHDKESDALN